MRRPEGTQEMLYFPGFSFRRFADFFIADQKDGGVAIGN